MVPAASLPRVRTVDLVVVRVAVASDVLAAACGGMVLLAISLANAKSYRTGVDLPYWVHAAWLIARGERAHLSFRAAHLIADHACLVFYPVAWITRSVPAVPALLAVQAAALAAATVPIHRIARRGAGLAPAPAAAVTLAFLLHPALLNVNMADFHPEVVAVPALAGAVLFAHDRRWLPYACCVAVVLLSKEDLPLAAAALGATLACNRGRRTAGLVTLGASLGWLAFVVGWLQPHLAEGHLINAVLLGRYGSGPLSIAAGLASHPGDVLRDVATVPNGRMLAGLFLPVLLLPLGSPRWLAPAAPILALNLLSGREGAHSIDYQYTVGILPFLAVALAHTLAKLWARRVLLVCVIAATIAGSVLWARPVTERFWTWRFDASDAARVEAASMIEPDAAVSAGDRTAVLVAARRDVYRFPGPVADYSPLADPVPLETRRAQVRYVFVDTSEPVQWTAHTAAWLEHLRGDGFIEVFNRTGIVLLERQGSGGRRRSSVQSGG